MPTFKLRIWQSQTLYDCRDHTVEATDIETAAAMLTKASQLGGNENFSRYWHITNAIRALDPCEITDGDGGVVEINANGDKIREIDIGLVGYDDLKVGLQPNP